MHDGDDDRDDADDGVIPHLKCDVEMEFEGPNDATMNKWAADVLRRLADRFGLLRHVWHPALFVFATYMIVLSSIVLLAAR